MAETQVRLNGQEVLSTGSVVAYFDGAVSLAFPAGTDWVEVDFIPTKVDTKSEQSFRFTVEKARKSDGQRLEVILSVRAGGAGFTTRGPIYVGDTGGRKIFANYSVIATTEHAVVLCYTFTWHEPVNG